MKQNLAKLVKEESVLKALKYFELKKPFLEPSTKFDLEFNGIFKENIDRENQTYAKKQN